MNPMTEDSPSELRTTFQCFIFIQALEHRAGYACNVITERVLHKMFSWIYPETIPSDTGNYATESYIVTHNMLIAHIKVVKIYCRRTDKSLACMLMILLLPRKIQRTQL
jgi:hypothetical protein